MTLTSSALILFHFTMRFECAKYKNYTTTNITSQVQRTYDSPSMPLEFSKHNIPHKGKKNKYKHSTKPYPTQSHQMTPRNFSYTPDQISVTKQSIFTINTIHTNPQLHSTASRTLSRHPIITIPNNPLTDNITSTNINNKQKPYHSSVSHTHNTSLPIISLSTSHSFNLSQPSQNTSTRKRKKSPIQTTTTLPFSNSHIVPPN